MRHSHSTSRFVKKKKKEKKKLFMDTLARLTDTMRRDGRNRRTFSRRSAVSMVSRLLLRRRRVVVLDASLYRPSGTDPAQFASEGEDGRLVATGAKYSDMAPAVALGWHRLV